MTEIRCLWRSRCHFGMSAWSCGFGGWAVIMALATRIKPTATKAVRMVPPLRTSGQDFLLPDSNFRMGNLLSTPLCRLLQRPIHTDRGQNRHTRQPKIISDQRGDSSVIRQPDKQSQQQCQGGRDIG